MSLGTALSVLGLLADVVGVVLLAWSQHRLLDALSRWLDVQSPNADVSSFPVITARDRVDLWWPKRLGLLGWVAIAAGLGLQLVGVIVSSGARGS